MCKTALCQSLQETVLTLIGPRMLCHKFRLLFHGSRLKVARGQNNLLRSHWPYFLISLLFSTAILQKREWSLHQHFSLPRFLTEQLHSAPTEPAHSQSFEGTMTFLNSSSLGVNETAHPLWTPCTLANPGQKMLGSEKPVLLLQQEEKPLLSLP